MGEQHTVSRPLAWDGIGLHGGRPARVEVRPAPPGHGLVFFRADLPGSLPIPATLDHVVATDLATTLGLPGGPRVATVEHLIAACSGMGIDNAAIHVTGPELPILDGSALPFAEVLARDGGARQGVGRSRFAVVRDVTLDDPQTGRRAVLRPAAGFGITCEIAFDHPLLRSGSYRYEEGETDFAAQLAPARTFGLLRDVEAMRARGLALGGSLDNAVVFDEQGVMNPSGLRWPDEAVRHKVLDALGDLALLGGRLRGRLLASRSGHAFNLALVRKAVAEGAIAGGETACHRSGVGP